MRNRFFPVAAVLVVALFALLAMSCSQGDDGDLNPLSGFVGTWTTTIGSATYTFTFAADGTGTIEVTDPPTTGEFNYWATTNILWIMPADSGSTGYDYEGAYTLTADTLNFLSEGTVLTRE